MEDKGNINKAQERVRQLNEIIKEKQEKVKTLEESEKRTGIKSFLLEDLRKDLARDIREQTQLKAEIKNVNKANKKDDRANKEYNEFVKQFVNEDGTLNEERINKKLELNNEFIENTNRTISNLEKEIAGKQNLLEKINGNNEEASKKLKEDIEKSKKQVEEEKSRVRHIEKNIEKVNVHKNAYQKYGDQIERLRTIKQNFANNLKEQERIKRESEKQINRSKRNLQVINRKLKDEKLLKRMDNNEYNQLLIDKESNEKTINEKTVALHNANRRILSLQSKINRVDIAWKTLFSNKDWDEINVKVGTESKSYTRETPENGIKLNGENKTTEKINNNKETPKIAENKEILDAETEELEDKSLTKVKKFSFRNLWNRFKNFIKSRFSEDALENDEIDTENEENIKIEDQKDKIDMDELGSKIENETERIINKDDKKDKEDRVDNVSKDNRDDKDDFMEKLRVNVDKDYAKVVKEEKEKAEIERHQIAPKSNEEKNQDELEK